MTTEGSMLLIRIGNIQSYEESPHEELTDVSVVDKAFSFEQVFADHVVRD